LIIMTAPQIDAADLKLTLARAFDQAWEEFVRTEGAIADTPENRGSLAARIVVLARSGETDEAQMGSASLIYLRALVAAKRIILDKSSNPAQEPLSAAPSMNQDGIDAAASALEACLEELPEGLSGSARQILSEAILENAGTGCRDPRELKHFALEALRSRL
jgi:hypothetical protein